MKREKKVRNFVKENWRELAMVTTATVTGVAIGMAIKQGEMNRIFTWSNRKAAIDFTNKFFKGPTGKRMGLFVGTQQTKEEIAELFNEHVHALSDEAKFNVMLIRPEE